MENSSPAPFIYCVSLGVRTEFSEGQKDEEREVELRGGETRKVILKVSARDFLQKFSS